jgi:hypothetical protein
VKDSDIHALLWRAYVALVALSDTKWRVANVELLVRLRDAGRRLRSFEGLNVHPFSSGGGSGIPDRDCVVCGLPDHHPVHQLPVGRHTFCGLANTCLTCGETIHDAIHFVKGGPFCEHPGIGIGQQCPYCSGVVRKYSKEVL